MPVLDALPHLTIIRGLKGILDFYYWKGVPCVRKWPVIPPSSRTPRSLESARIFGAIVAAYSLLGAILKELFANAAADQPRTARDLFVSAVLGHLHDHNMSDFLDLLTEATAYLAIIKDLADALQSNATDRLIVRGENQLFTYKDQYLEQKRNVSAALGTNILTSSTVPPGEIWMITTTAAINDTTLCSEIRIQIGPAVPKGRLAQKANPPLATSVHTIGPALLKPGNYLEARFEGCLLGDNIFFSLNGYTMTLET